jgi:hypothetical protein
MRIRGIINRSELWLNEQDHWDVESQAREFTEHEAHLKLRILNANNRFLEADEQVEAMIVESK